MQAQFELDAAVAKACGTRLDAAFDKTGIVQQAAALKAVQHGINTRRRIVLLFSQGLRPAQQLATQLLA
jgi:hypothetical protein